MSDKKTDILEKLIQLHEQGIFRKHDTFIGQCIGEAINEIVSLRHANHIIVERAQAIRNELDGIL